MVILKTAKDLLRSELSVWSMAKSQEDRRYAKIHPAAMPVDLATKILELTLDEPVGERWVLDPMVGVGSVCLAGLRLGANCLGFDISKEFIRIASERVKQEHSLHPYLGVKKPECRLICEDARELDRHAGDMKIDVAVTSPPYFAIMHGKQTFTKGVERPYTREEKDIGNIFHYETFLKELSQIYTKVFGVLKSGGWFVPVVGDANILRSNFPEAKWEAIGLGGRQHVFFPVHVDVINILREIGFEIHGIVNWDRRQDYNYLHSIGWRKEPSERRFITIRVHEYIIFSRRPSDS